jgi:hypothetical protein
MYSLDILIFEIVTGMGNHPVRTDLSAYRFIFVKEACKTITYTSFRLCRYVVIDQIYVAII